MADEAKVSVKVGGTGWINRADGTKTPIVVESEPVSEEQAKQSGAVKQESEGDKQ